jgi:hypothetical protein
MPTFLRKEPRVEDALDHYWSAALARRNAALVISR